MLSDLMHQQYAAFLIVVIALVISISVHECGHAIADELQGDPTARNAGRITLNPIKHLDPFGALMIVLVGFGWGRPVPINPAAMRNRRFGAAIVGFAGPVTNIILAFGTALVARVTNIPLFSFTPSIGQQFVLEFLYINIILAMLNLLPIPPLDGSRILGAILPPEKQRFIFFMDQWGFVVLLLLALFVLPNVFSRVGPHVELFVLRVVGYPGA
jgi:Zn-dependent protease